MGEGDGGAAGYCGNVYVSSERNDDGSENGPNTNIFQ